MRVLFPSRIISLFHFGAVCLLLITQISQFSPVKAAPETEQVEALYQAGEPKLILTKSVEGNLTQVKVGDVIRYRIRFECSSLTTECGQMEITDTLQNGLIYLPPPNSSVPSGFSISYNSGTRTVTITKTDGHLLDGSQFDAVIAVRVDNDLRPVPGVIDNTIEGQIYPPGASAWQPADPALAPHINVTGVEPAWVLTKTRVAPVVLPTPDTDVTYQLRLCPSTPTDPTKGVAALENIVFTDTLPAGSVFVSAANGGTYDSGTHTVTWDSSVWPALAGPIYPPVGPINPPDCVSTLVTLRYPSPTFTTGSTNLTNTANATADYTPDGGGTCAPNCYDSGTVNIIHNLTTIIDTPTYSKDDYGDPVGWTGTGRFILNLNTNLTNYPANNVTMIDNLPEELEVTSITSGTWDAAFDNVRATISYSTDNGSNWTVLGTVDYDDNATYPAPVVNITNVRWAFEYDPERDGSYINGLPYVWEFASQPDKQPEIRVIPRQTQYPALPAPAELDPAVVGQTYNNCVYLTRTTADGPDADTLPDDVTDPCANQDMTVRGDYASLRVSKYETPGEPYDKWGNPYILPAPASPVFTEDNTILPGDTVLYTVVVELTERSSAPLVDPTVLDTLPSDLVFVRDGDVRYIDGSTTTVLTKDTGSGGDYTFAQSGVNPSANNTLKWEFDYQVDQKSLGSRYLEMDIYARIPAGQGEGTRTNDLYVTTDSVDVLCEISGTQDVDDANIDGDLSSAEVACKTDDDYVVDKSAALRGEKWIRSIDPINNVVVNMDTFLPDASCPDGGTVGLTDIPTNPFTRFPCIAQAFPEGSIPPGQYVYDPPTYPFDPELDDFEYNLRIFNEGNVNMLDYVLYDILPYYGDKGSGGTLANSARSSEFRPVLTGPIEFIGGSGLTDSAFTIEYNLTTNPCRPEVFNEDPGDVIPANCDDTWYENGVDTIGWTATQWAAVRSFRIRLNAGEEILPYVEFSPTPDANVVRFGVLMSIPKDSPIVGLFNSDDAQSLEITWNSFAHIGSYETGLVTEPIRDLLASEPRKVGITIPEVMSIGNRVWRDSDNSGTINPPDDTDPGIGGVIVNLYRDANNDGIPDGPAIATTVTDYDSTDPNNIDKGYYLFSNIPYDRVDATQNRYIVGIPAINFGAADPDGAGPLTQGALYNLRSSTGTPADTKYTTTPLDSNVESEDHGRDPVALGGEVFSPTITLQPNTEPSNDTDISDDDADGPDGTRRGLNGESNSDSDLTVDFGFFGGTDVPFSIGNYLWYDNGAGANLNNGVRDAGELPVVGAVVYIYRDGNGNNIPDAGERIFNRSDITDVNGFYLFDNLDPGTYFVHVVAGNFTDSFDPDGAGPLPTAPGVLRGWYSSQPTGQENSTQSGGTTTAAIDADDNGVNTDIPDLRGVFSGPVILTRDVADPEPSGETHLSGQADPGLPTNDDFDPTGWDGDSDPVAPGVQGSRGRYGETDASSNLTIDFGFIPPMSLGNRVWIDNGSTLAGVNLSQFNDGILNGNEAGVSGVRVELYRDTSNDGILQPGEFIRATTTDASGYYLFQQLEPANNYFIHIPNDNFGDTGVGDLVPGNPLLNYLSSTTLVGPFDDATESNDNGIDDVNPFANGITSQVIAMAYRVEPTTPPESDFSTDTVTYGTNNVGTYGQLDANSNLTMDFGFVRPPRSLGNHLWLDTGGGTPANINNGVFDTGESPVVGALVSLYRDANADGQPDDLGTLGDRTDDFLAQDITDANGYYLFGNLPPLNYLVGVDADNFNAGGSYSALLGYTSSTNNVDNAGNNTDKLDNGIDVLNPTTGFGVLSTTIDLTATPLVGLPTSETGSGNPADGATNGYRGTHGETDANSDLTIDFGFVEAYALGNRVWFDTDNDGLMDVDLVTPANSEQPIAGVQVALYHADAGGNPTTAVLANGVARTSVTNANGYYLFDYLAPGDYVVVVTADNFNATGTYNALVGYWSSRTTMSNAGVVTESAANTPDPDTGLLAGTADDDLDLDDNGTRQTTGAFTNAVISKAVTLGPIGATEPTNDDDLDGGNQGDQPDDRANMSVDFGFYKTEIGNLVFEDVNINGTYNSGTDNLIVGARVLLYNANNNAEILVGPDGILGTADDAANGVLTNASGQYQFGGLPAGDYVIRVTSLPTAGMISTIDNGSAPMQSDNDNPDWNLDNNDNGNGEGVVTVTSETVNRLTMTPGGGTMPDANPKTAVTVNQVSGTTTDLTVDFGFVKSYSLGNRVWFDTDNDGVFDAGEVGVNNVRVQLYQDTNSNSSYDPGTDLEVNVGPDGRRSTADDAAGGVLTATNSGNPGYYRFDNLFPGNYLVVLPSTNFTSGDATDALVGYWSTGTSYNSATNVVEESLTNDPNNDYDQSDTTAPIVLTFGDENGKTTFTANKISYVASDAVTLGAEAEPTDDDSPVPGIQTNEAPDDRSNRTVDFGFYRTEIGNLVFHDIDQSGHFNTGDTATNGITVKLFDGNGDEVQVGPDGIFGTSDDAAGGVVTGPLAVVHPAWAAGEYHFSGLPQGSYTVQVTLPAGSYSSIDSNPQTDNDNPNVNTNNNDNGVGTTGGVVSSNTTNPLVMNPGVDAAKPNRTVTNGTGTTTDNTVDFGYVELVAIGNRIWFDTGVAAGHTNNGILDGDETGVPDGLIVELRRTSDNFLVGTTTTFTSAGNPGYYFFDNLLPGTYYVQIPAAEFASGRPLFGYVSSAGAGADDDNDQTADENGIDALPASPPISAGIKTQNFALAANGEITAEDQTGYSGVLDDNNVNFTADFGFVEAYALGNRVWYDTDNDGLMDVDLVTPANSEQPIDGVQVSLYRADGSGNPTGDVLDTVVTNIDGYYLFDNLTPGNYVVVITADNFNVTGTYNKLVGYWSSLTTLLANGTISETAAPDPDFGLDGISGNADDNLDNNDDNGTRTTLAGFVGAVISGPVTLGPIGLTEPVSESQTEAVIGQGAQPDGRANMTVDFGFYRTAIGNLVFDDADLDGGNNSEPPLQNIPVTLHSSDGTQIRVGADGIYGTADDGTTNPVLTNAAGNYLFTGLPDGNYIVRINIPTGSVSTKDTLDSADSNNPNTNTDGNDNGIGEGTGTISSSTVNPLNTNPGSTGTAGHNTVDNITGTTTDPTVDFGIVPGYGLGNRVWFDTNNNGVMDGAEVGIEDVVVNLYAADVFGNPTDPILATVMTNASGFYLFDDLFPRDYVVVIPASNFNTGNPLAGYWSSGTTISGGVPVENLAPAAPAPDPDTDLDVDDNGTRSSLAGFTGAIISQAVTLGNSAEPLNEIAAQLEAGVNQGHQPDNRANMTVDFGFYKVAIGNLVYMDNNVNGISDGGDTPIQNAIVHLFNGTDEVVTGRDGILGTADDGWGPDGVNNSGAGDDGDGGMPTNATGNYLFSGLPAGDYIIKVDPIAGTYSTVDTSNPADTLDPDTHFDDNDNGVGQGNTIVSSNILTMSGGEVGMFSDATGITTDTTLDFGFVQMVAIGNRVWFDTGAGNPLNANNGRLDAGEVGVNDVTVQLWSVGANGVMGGGDDSQVGSDTVTASISGNDGYYQFDNLFPGLYYVKIPASEFTASGDLFGYVSSVGYGAVDIDSDQNVDENGIDSIPAAPLTTNGIVTPIYTLRAGSEPASPIDEHTGGIYTGSLPDASVNFTADFGFVQLVAIGNRVWIDDGAGGGTADDGIQQPGELGINGVRVELYRQGQTAGTDTPVAVVTTSGGGNYVFDNLVPGNYFVHIPNDNFGAVTGDTVPGDPLAGYLSSKGAGADEVSDQTADENGIDAISTATAPITVGVSSNVFALAYDDETTADDETGYPGILSDSSVNYTADFGFVQKVAIGNFVWLDNGAGGGTANDGIRNGTEPGIQNVIVQLFNPVDGIIGNGNDVQVGSNTTTDVNGRYIFDNLLPGLYYVVIPASNFDQTTDPLFNLLSSTGAGANETTDQNGDENGIDQANPAATGITSMIYTLAVDSESMADDDTGYNGALDDNNVNLTADFGFTELVAIGNRIWFDTGVGAAYNNGILDGGEAGVPNGITVELHRSSDNSLVATTTTTTVGGNPGYYQFDNLLPGSYYVQIPATEFDTNTDALYGYVSSLGTGAAGDNDDHLGVNGDENGQDVNPLIAGIRTPAYNLQPNTMTFPDEHAGVYSGNLDDNNVNFTADFGFTQLVAIGNRVWYDIGGGAGGFANDGIQNGSEAGANGVTVQLYRQGDPIGSPLLTTTTDASGNYVFDNLNPGNYFIHIPAIMFDTTAPSPLEGFLSSTGAGSSETADQTVDENGIDVANLDVNGISSMVFTLQPNTEPSPATTDDIDSGYNGYLDDDNVNYTADFGFLNIVAIGNRVWLDTGAGAGGVANDGIQNGTEPGVNGVLVELYLSTQTPGVDTPLEFTTTDATGYYVFDNLLAGTYIIHIPASNFNNVGDPLYGYYSSEGNGSNETTDHLGATGDENGIDQPAPAVSGITSTPYILSANSEPSSAVPATDDNDTGYIGVLDDNDVNFTADFGFVQKYSLGNRVWFDTNNNAVMDGSEVGVKDVLVELYRADAGGNPTGTLVASDITANGGYYLFDNIYPDDYVVVIPADNFIDSGAADTYKALAGYWSSRTVMQANGTIGETAAPDPDDNGADGTANTGDDDVDVDDNGTHTTLAGFNGAVISGPVTIGYDGDTEPTDEVASQKEAGIGDGSQPNGRSNLKVDFGFYRLSVGDLVFSDGINDGTYLAADDAILSGVTLHLFASNGTTEIPVGADGKLGTADDGLSGVVTDASGLYRFDGLPAGDYIIRVDAPTGTSSTIDNGSPAMQSDNDNPNDNLNNNDNGDGISGGVVSAAPITLTAGTLGSLGQNVITDGVGSTHNPTMDFGFTPVFALGNRVWFDTNNNRVMDTGEVGVDDVEILLFDNSGNQILIGADGIIGTADDGTTNPVLTANGGYYLFNGLEAGNYVVVIAASNFASGGELEGYWSSETRYNSTTGILEETLAHSPETSQDSDDNGTRQTSGAFNNAVVSQAVTLGPNPTEPTNDDDLDITLPGSQQGQPDLQANMSVDFGFYTITLGDLVWVDSDNSGTITGTEAGIDGVIVHLYPVDGAGNPVGSPLITTTAGGGQYSFAGLPQGNYIVRLPESNFQGLAVLRDYYSSTGAGNLYEPAPNPDVVTTDSDDNGTEVGTLGFAGGYIQSGVFALTPTFEASYDNGFGITNEPRVDIGIRRDPQVNLSIVKTETPAKGYYLQGETTTYSIVVTNHGPADVTDAVVTDAMPLDGSSNPMFSDWDWACTTTGGATCAPQSNLTGDFSDTVNMPYGSTITYTVTATVTNTATGILANIATVTAPSGVTEKTLTDNSSTDTNEPASLTITKDDGLTVVAPNTLLTYTITVTNNGAVDLSSITVTDTLPATDMIFQSANPAPASAPAPNTPGGTLTWTGLSLATGASTTITVTAQVIPTAVGPDIVNSVTATDSNTKATATTTDTDAIAWDKTKVLTGTSEAFTPETFVAPATARPVAIGEVLTYEISVKVPPNSTLTNLKALDIMDAGLSFVRCVSISTDADLTTDLTGGFPAVCNAPVDPLVSPTQNPTVAREPAGDPNAYNDGRRIEFTLGNVTNTSLTEVRTLTIAYEAIVLDIPSNVNGAPVLDNRVTWSWQGGTLSASAAPVEVKEPQLSIEKNANQVIAQLDSAITFTITIAHTPQSAMDAFDVIVTDDLPAGLALIPGTIAFTGSAPDNTTYDTVTGLLTFTWDEFGLLETSTITFQANFVGPAPVTNSANVQWTSLPIDPQPNGSPQLLSTFNNYATERWYDPADQTGLNSYGVMSSIVINVPAGKRLPKTGFEPGVVTQLPPMPKDFAYAQTEVVIEIPKLNQKLTLVGVPFNNETGEWDLRWLGNEAGWLEYTAFPTHSGNSAITAHTTLANGKDGPFAKLDTLNYGDQIIVHIGGQRYIYEVRSRLQVSPDAVNTVLKHEELSWLTLITCKSYNETTGEYNYRTVVRAVLLKVEAE